jgi:hypothetical protein
MRVGQSWRRLGRLIWLDDTLFMTGRGVCRMKFGTIRFNSEFAMKFRRFDNEKLD